MPPNDRASPGVGGSYDRLLGQRPQVAGQTGRRRLLRVENVRRAMCCPATQAACSPGCPEPATYSYPLDIHITLLYTGNRFLKET